MLTRRQMHLSNSTNTVSRSVAIVVTVVLMLMMTGCSSVAFAALQPPLYDYPSASQYPNTDAVTEFEGYFTRVVDNGEMDDDTNPYWVDDNWVFDQFDIQFDKFSELRVQTYLQLLSDATGFPVSSIVPVNNVAGKRGLEYGLTTLFSVQLVGARPRRSNESDVATTASTSTPPTTPDPNATTTTTTTTPATPPTFAPPPGFTTTTPPTTTTTPAPTEPRTIYYLPSDASVFVNAVRRSLANTRSPLTIETAFTIRRVYPTVRQYVTAETGVNYYWVTFILLSVIMVGVSIYLVFHYRSTSENPSELLGEEERDEERGLAEQEMMEFDDASARRDELDKKLHKSKMAKIREAAENEQPLPLTYEDVRNKEWEAYLEEESRNTMLFGDNDNDDDEDDSGRRAIQEAFNDGAFTSVSRAIDEAKQEVAAHPYIYGNMASLDDDGLGAGNEAEEKQKEARRQAEALVEEEERQRVEKLPFVQTILHDKSFALPLADEEAKVKMQRKKRAALIKAAKAAAAMRAGRAVTDDAEQELDEAGKAALADMSDPDDPEDVKVGKRIRRERRRRENAEIKGYQGYVQLSKTELFDITKAQTIFQANVERGGFKTPIVKRLVDLGIMHYDPVLDTYEVIPEEDRNDPFKQLSTYVPPPKKGGGGSDPAARNEIEALNEPPTNLEEYAPRAFGNKPPPTSTNPSRQYGAAAASSSPVNGGEDDATLYSDPHASALSTDSNPLDLSPDNNDDLDYRSQTTGGDDVDGGDGGAIGISDASLDLDVDTDKEDEHIDFGAKEAYVSTSSEDGSEPFEL